MKTEGVVTREPPEETQPVVSIRGYTERREWNYNLTFQTCSFALPLCLTDQNINADKFFQAIMIPFVFFPQQIKVHLVCLSIGKRIMHVIFSHQQQRRHETEPVIN